MPAAIRPLPPLSLQHSVGRSVGACGFIQLVGARPNEYYQRHVLSSASTAMRSG